MSKIALSATDQAAQLPIKILLGAGCSMALLLLLLSHMAHLTALSFFEFKAGPAASAIALNAGSHAEKVSFLLVIFAFAVFLSAVCLALYMVIIMPRNQNH